MVKVCPICGVRLKIIRNGELFCPNCGLIEEECERKREEDGLKQSYVD